MLSLIVHVSGFLQRHLLVKLTRLITCLADFKEGHMRWQMVVSLVVCPSNFNIVVVTGLFFMESQTKGMYEACVWLRWWFPRRCCC